MNTQRMTVRQLSGTVDSMEKIYLRSMYGGTDENLVQLSYRIRGLEGILTLEVYSLTYFDDMGGFIADVAMPVEVLKALKTEE